MAEDLRPLIRDWFESVWNRHDESSIDRLAWPDAIAHGLDGNNHPAPGMDTFRALYRSFLAAFPDIQLKIEDNLQDGDKTITRLSFSGTHQGEGLGISPTQRRFTATAIVISRWRAGKIAEAWNEFDAAGMMRQLQTPAAKLRPGA